MPPWTMAPCARRVKIDMCVSICEAQWPVLEEGRAHLGTRDTHRQSHSPMLSIRACFKSLPCLHRRDVLRPPTPPRRRSRPPPSASGASWRAPPSSRRRRGAGAAGRVRQVAGRDRRDVHGLPESSLARRILDERDQLLAPLPLHCPPASRVNPSSVACPPTSVRPTATRSRPRRSDPPAPAAPRLG